MGTKKAPKEKRDGNKIWDSIHISLYKNPCVFNAFARAQWRLEHGWKLGDVRIGIGTFVPSRTRHAWCEYKSKRTGKWLLAKDSIWQYTGGWPIESYTTAGVRDYHVVRYEYPSLDELRSL